MSLRRLSLWGIVCLTLCALSARHLQAAVLYNENSSADLSDNQAAPNPFTLSAGTNSIIGNVGGANTQDWVALTVPSGFQLSSVILAAYQSSDVQGFTGLQAGSSFVGSPFTAGSYAGYAHFGTAASNGVDSPPLASNLPADIRGINILPNMGLNGPTNTGAGSTGFTAPLPAGTYTFLIQQLGASTSYQFDYGVTAVPEPATLGLLALGSMALLATGLRKVRRKA